MTTLPHELDFSKLTYGPKKQVSNGGPANCSLLYEGKSLKLQLPRIKVPFGLSVPDAKYNPSQDKFTFELSLDTTDPKIAELKKILEKFDEYNLGFVAKQSQELLGASSSIEEVKKFNFYTSMIRFSVEKGTTKKNTNYPERLRVKLPFNKKEPGFVVYDTTKQPKTFWTPPDAIDWSWATKGMEIIPIVQAEGLWIISGKAYFGWRMAAVRLCEGTSKEVAFRDDALGDGPAEENDIGIPTALVVGDENFVEEENEEKERF